MSKNSLICKQKGKAVAMLSGLVAKGAKSKIFMKAQHYSPEILLVLGGIGVVAGTVMACKATLKAPEILEKAKENIEAVHECQEKKPEEYSKKDAQKDLTIIYAKTALDLSKNYAKATSTILLSLTAFAFAYKIIKGRHLKLIASCTAIEKSFREYRDRVADKFGDDVEKRIRYNIQEEEVKEKITDENGHTKTVKKKVDYIDSDTDITKYRRFSRYFDPCSCHFDKDPQVNKVFLQSAEEYFNGELVRKGFVFLNEVYDKLGFEPIEEGQSWGWVYDKNITRKISFGIFNINSKASREFVNGYEPVILLDFNVDDGPITEKVWGKKGGK